MMSNHLDTVAVLAMGILAMGSPGLTQPRDAEARDAAAETAARQALETFITQWAHSRFPGHALTPTGVMAIRCKQFHLPDL